MRLELPDEQREVFALALRTLNDANVRYVVAGAFSVFYYTSIWRNTKDMDIFLLEADVPRAMEALARQGFRTWCEADYWLGKATKDDCLVDLIFGSGNWLQPIDQLWFDRAEPATLFGLPILMAPVEEIVWSKAFVAVRHRYDGSDIVHLIEARGDRLDWSHLINRFRSHWELLFSYLMLFRYVYPSRRAVMPDWVMREFIARIERQLEHPVPRPAPICRGTLIDRFGFIVDVEQRGFIDAREQVAADRGYEVDAVLEDRRNAEDFLRQQEPG